MLALYNRLSHHEVYTHEYQCCMQAAHNEASALGAVTAWYRDVQQKHVAAGLGDDPIIAYILPGSSRKLKRGEAPANDKPQADSMAVSPPYHCTPRFMLHS